jgi:hypothetical protein
VAIVLLMHYALICFLNVEYKEIEESEEKFLEHFQIDQLGNI